MSYYYDVLLNFQEKYYMFYEWDKEDNMEFIKKIPLFHVNQKTFLDLFAKKVKVKEDFLLKIENKTKLKQSTLLYAAIFSDGKNSIALEFNNDGITLSKSSLLTQDELNINEFMYNIELSYLNYEIISKDEFSNVSRQEEKTKKLLKIEIDSMYKKKEYSKLKYIFLEWFNELNDNYNDMYKKMINKINDRLSKKEYEIYELIKITYNV